MSCHPHDVWAGAGSLSPVAEGCLPKPGENHASPGDLLPGCVPTHVFFPLVKVQGTIPAHSSQKVGSLISDFLSLDDKWFSSKRYICILKISVNSGSFMME